MAVAVELLVVVPVLIAELWAVALPEEVLKLVPEELAVALTEDEPDSENEPDALLEGDADDKWDFWDEPDMLGDSELENDSVADPDDDCKGETDWELDGEYDEEADELVEGLDELDRVLEEDAVRIGQTLVEWDGEPDDIWDMLALLEALLVTDPEPAWEVVGEIVGELEEDDELENVWRIEPEGELVCELDVVWDAVSLDEIVGEWLVVELTVVIWLWEGDGVYEIIDEVEGEPDDDPLVVELAVIWELFDAAADVVWELVGELVDVGCGVLDEVAERFDVDETSGDADEDMDAVFEVDGDIV